MTEASQHTTSEEPKPRVERDSGVLLHPTSLPGPGPIGDIGPAARAFVDFLNETRQRTWQVLPLGPTGGGGSPYSAYSSIAGNPLLISPDALVEDGLLPAAEDHRPPSAGEAVDYGAAGPAKRAMLARAFESFVADAGRRDSLASFCELEADWLDDYALFMALKDAHDQRAWLTWEPALRGREPDAIARARSDLAPGVAFHQFSQFVFYRQWAELRTHAGERDVRIVGDIPFYVALDSVDAWANPRCFLLDADDAPRFIAGVPPDYFSETGQLWGNPIYDWARLEERGFDWWIDRVAKLLRLVDVVRIDHFRGFESFWRVPSGEPTAENGEWIPGPGAPLFRAIEGALGPLPIWAEDLGVITPEVERLRDDLGFPGMKVLQFAFSDPANPYLPFHHEPNAVVYTGTHDNDTTRGWWAQLDEDTRTRVRDYFDWFDEREVHWQLIRLAMSSVARHVVIPLQDLLGLGGEARMNVPGEAEGNWRWRFDASALTEEIGARLRGLTEIYDRSRAEDPAPE